MPVDNRGPDRCWAADELAGGRKSVELRKRVGDVVPGCFLLHMEMVAKANPPMLVEAAEMDADCSGYGVL